MTGGIAGRRAPENVLPAEGRSDNNTLMESLSMFVPFIQIADVVSAFRISNASGQVIVVILLIGSVFAWSIMVTKFAELAAASRNAERFLSAYRNSLHPLALFLADRKQPPSPLYAVYADMCEQLLRAAGMRDGDRRLLPDEHAPAPSLKEHQVRAIRALSEQFLAERMLDLEKHMGILATATTAAPFLGLLGTVWGVMDAFGGLAMSATATLSAVAPGVSGALLTTVVGLVVALPSSIGYNMLVGRIRRLSLIAERFVQEFAGDVEDHFARGQ